MGAGAGLDVPLEVAIGDLTRSGLRVREGSLTGRVLRRPRAGRPPDPRTPEL